MLSSILYTPFWSPLCAGVTDTDDDETTKPTEEEHQRKGSDRPQQRRSSRQRLARLSIVGGLHKKSSTKAKIWVENTSGDEQHRQQRKEVKRIKPKTPLQRRLFHDRLSEIPAPSLFSSTHAAINRERVMRGLPCLKRNTGLDEVARKHAEAMAGVDRVFVSNDGHLRRVVTTAANADAENEDAAIGQNVIRGSSVAGMQNRLMRSKRNRLNVLDDRFVHMGVGTASGEDGRLYLCQIFRN